MHTNLHEVGGGNIPDHLKAWIARVKETWKNTIVIRYNQSTKHIDYYWTNDGRRITIPHWINQPEIIEKEEISRYEFIENLAKYRSDMHETI